VEVVVLVGIGHSHTRQACTHTKYNHVSHWVKCCITTDVDTEDIDAVNCHIILCHKTPHPYHSAIRYSRRMQ